MGFDLSRRVGLFVLGGAGAGIVFEKQANDDRVPVQILGGPDAARLWVDGHYEEVDWESSDRATASVGRLREPARPTRLPPRARAGHGRTAHSPTRLTSCVPTFLSW
jgi:hypothetical protein